MACNVKAMIFKNLLKHFTHHPLFNNLHCCYEAQAECLFCNYSILRHHVARPSKDNMKVCVIGAAGCVGSKIALLMKLSPLVNSLCLYDIKTEIDGIAEDLSHISSKCKVDAFVGRALLSQALAGSKIVIICASERRTPGMSMCKLFEPNASITYDIAKACAKTCPKANIIVVSQPVDSLLPLISEVYKEHHVYESRKLIGSTSCNVMRSITLLSESVKCSPSDIIVPVIGGHSKNTIVPVFSRAYPDPVTYNAQPEKRAELKKKLSPYTRKVQSDLIQATVHDMNLIVKNSEDWIFSAKDCQESAAVAGASSAYSTAVKVIQAMNMENNVHDYAYVKTDAVPGLTYSTTLVQYGAHGVTTGRPTRANSELEKKMLLEAVEELRESIEKGEQYVHKRQ